MSSVVKLENLNSAMLTSEITAQFWMDPTGASLSHKDKCIFAFQVWILQNQAEWLHDRQFLVKTTQVKHSGTPNKSSSKHPSTTYQHFPPSPKPESLSMEYSTATPPTPTKHSPRTHDLPQYPDRSARSAKLNLVARELWSPP
mmetsp:Transcript_2421/g.4270  ORF Transcript_2421/g.4270 Transcript_2421/m.4270 type:complete len:143 (+) Transcript_2421:1754-2182(+)